MSQNVYRPRSHSGFVGLALICFIPLGSMIVQGCAAQSSDRARSAGSQLWPSKTVAIITPLEGPLNALTVREEVEKHGVTVSEVFLIYSRSDYSGYSARTRNRALVNLKSCPGADIIIDDDSIVMSPPSRLALSLGGIDGIVYIAGGNDLFWTYYYDIARGTQEGAPGTTLLRMKDYLWRTKAGMTKSILQTLHATGISRPALPLTSVEVSLVASALAALPTTLREDMRHSGRPQLMDSLVNKRMADTCRYLAQHTSLDTTKALLKQSALFYDSLCVIAGKELAKATAVEALLPGEDERVGRFLVSFASEDTDFRDYLSSKSGEWHTQYALRNGCIIAYEPLSPSHMLLANQLQMSLEHFLIMSNYQDAGFLKQRLKEYPRSKGRKSYERFVFIKGTPVRYAVTVLTWDELNRVAVINDDFPRMWNWINSSQPPFTQILRSNQRALDLLKSSLGVQ